MNNRTTTVVFRTTPEIKTKAETLFTSLGMSLSFAAELLSKLTYATLLKYRFPELYITLLRRTFRVISTC